MKTWHYIVGGLAAVGAGVFAFSRTSSAAAGGGGKVPGDGMDRVRALSAAKRARLGTDAAAKAAAGVPTPPSSIPSKPMVYQTNLSTGTKPGIVPR